MDGVHNKVIIFDFGGVLGSDVRYTYLHSLLSPEKKEEVARWVKKIGWDKMKTDPSYTEEMFWQDVIKQGQLEGITTVAKLAESVRHFKVYYETVAVASRLRKRGYTIGVLSNHSKEWFNYVIDRYNFREVFTVAELVVPSYEVHCAKPQAIIYEKMYETCATYFRNNKKHELHDCIFVDNKQENVTAAEKLGYKGITYSSETDTPGKLVNSLIAFGVDAAER